LKDDNICFIIGGQRCGTTWLLNQLAKHPHILANNPLLPEPKFFIDPSNLIRGTDFYLNKFFAHREVGKVMVDKSTSYLEVGGTAERIYATFPKAKIIVSLRNPVYRAISNYFFSKMHGLENRTLEQVFIQNLPPPKINKKLSVDPFNYLQRGIYVNYLKPYLKHFEDNIHLVLYEEITEASSLSSLFSFLGVNSIDCDISLDKENDSIYDEEISGEILSNLTSFYIPFNKELEELTKINISAWDKY
jgi:hypothetical protein